MVLIDGEMATDEKANFTLGLGNFDQKGWHHLPDVTFTNDYQFKVARNNKHLCELTIKFMLLVKNNQVLFI